MSSNHPNRAWRRALRDASPDIAAAIYTKRTEGLQIDELLIRLMLVEAYETGFADGRQSTRRRDDRA